MQNYFSLSNYLIKFKLFLAQWFLENIFKEAIEADAKYILPYCIVAPNNP
jgi:hypothetical protein